MLIIFDLDDTLIDTSGCVTHFKLEDGLSAMVKAGLEVADFSESLDLLRRLNASAESARAAVEEFIEILGCEKKFVEIGVREIYETFSDSLSITPLNGAKEVLDELGRNHQLALVTVGRPIQQMEKLKKAGIDSRIFSKIAIIDERNKKPHYQMIAEELGYSPEEVLVCGDRVLVDLSPARELGFKTVQMQWGRGLNVLPNAIEYRRDVDYRISEIIEIKFIVNDIVTFSSF